MELESRGVPTVTVCSHLFQRLGNVERRSLGMPDLPMAITLHPIGGVAPQTAVAKAEALFDTVVAALTHG
ncbi:MAG: hypothetical protein OXR67_15945 [Chloroflexota bacterium]|nr:hypothetical protein [Chloroflexota bacterium]